MQFLHRPRIKVGQLSERRSQVARTMVVGVWGLHSEGRRLKAKGMECQGFGGTLCARLWHINFSISAEPDGKDFKLGKRVWSGT